MAPKSSLSKANSKKTTRAAHAVVPPSPVANGVNGKVAGASSSTIGEKEEAEVASIIVPASLSGASFTYSHLLLVLFFNAIVMAATLWSHYHLPTPLSMDVDSLSTPAHFSELVALEHISVLSDQIGYRIVGTRQHVEAEQWVESIVKQYEGWHHTVEQDSDGLNATGDPRGDTQVEVWTQIGDGSHRFDFMSSVVWKKYYSMSNVVVRISDGTDAGKEHAVLLNAHLDSTLPSPGA
jgi:hypothetical protein